MSTAPREETATQAVLAQKVAKPGKPGKPGSAQVVKSGKHGKTAKPISGAPEAKRRAAAILEVLAGARTPTQAAQALSVSLPRYYLLEQQAVQGLITACEPRDKGPGVSTERRIAQLERELVRSQRETSRQQALARVTQRTLGLATPAPAKQPPRQGKGSVKPGSKHRRRRPTVRALRAVAALRDDSCSSETKGAIEISPQNGPSPPDGNVAVAT